METKIGITGGIGSGKSVVAQLLRVMEIPVYDSDSEAKKLTLQDAGIRLELCSLLGEDLYKEGRLDKQFLSAYLFASHENAIRINKIIHPRVKAHFREWVARQAPRSLVALESAILVESGFTDCVDKIILVTAPLELRIRRAVTRDCTSEELVMKRIAAQMSDDERELYADFILENGYDTPLIPQVVRLVGLLKGEPLS